MFRGAIVTGPDCAGSDNVGPDCAGPDCAGPDRTCTLRVGFCAVAHRAIYSSRAIFCQQYLDIKDIKNILTNQTLWTFYTFYAILHAMLA
jgi:hypothetical protein